MFLIYSKLYFLDFIHRNFISRKFIVQISLNFRQIKSFPPSQQSL